MSQNIASKNQVKTPSEPWWRFGSSAWLLLGGLLLFNVGCFLQPSLLDMVFAGLFNLLDFRTWPWWYFLCLVAVLAFSVRWFFLYQKKINDDFDPVSAEEAKWFCRLTGAATGLLAVLVILHRTGMLRRMYGTLNYMFGYGAFSIWALLIFAVIFCLIGLFVYLTAKWIATLQVD